MNQLCIDFNAPTMPAARAAGHVAGELATDRAEREAPGFRQRAEAAILQRLAAGPASGEDLTDHVAASGVTFADGRALGGIYSSLRKRKLIRVVGTCNRRKGHGTAGGLIWGLC